jgi:hypothetical protein
LPEGGGTQVLRIYEKIIVLIQRAEHSWMLLERADPKSYATKDKAPAKTRMLMRYEEI